jgi:hypothetical protein
MKQSGSEVALAKPVLFAIGLPCGRWLEPASQAFGIELRERDPAAQVHGDLLRTPKAQALTAQDVDRLREARLTPREWCAGAIASPGGSSVGGADARLCWTASALADACPDARFVVWVEHPGRALANWLVASESGEDPCRILNLLSSATAELLQFVQRHRERCLVVDVDDALSHPQQLAERLLAWQLRRPVPMNLTVTPSADALAQIVGAQWAAADEALMRANEHLSASCVMLQGSGYLDLLEPDPASLVADAVDLYRERLLRQIRAYDALLTERDNAFAEAESDRQRAEHLASEHEELKRKAADLAMEREKLEKRAAAASQDAEAVLLQLHRLQEKVAQEFLVVPAGASGVGLAPAHRHVVRIGAVDPGAAAETAPLRGLTLNLLDVKSAGRSYEQLTVRLVEHHGRPGLAVFEAGATAAKPLRTWVPTGEKSHRAFMLFVPDDPASRERLVGLGTGDWRFVHGLALAIDRHLQTSSPAVAPRWAVIAKRLVKRFEGLPASFRFDAIDVSSQQPQSGALRITFREVSFGQQEAASLPLIWRANAGDAPDGIELLALEEFGGNPTLQGWPVEDDGTWSAHWKLPITGASERQRAEAWAKMTRDDKDMLLGVLAALPAAVRRAVELGVIAPERSEPLGAAAADALRDANRLMRGSRLRQAWAAARGLVNS